MESLPAMCASQQTLFTEQVPAAIAMFDREMRYLAVSRRYLSDLALLFSTAIFAPSEVIGRSFHEISPDMPQRWHAIHARALAGEELAQEEELGLRPDGAIVWGRKTVGCVRKSDGSIDYCVSVIEDISARKHAEEQVHLLMREANHRAKNMLGLVQAIAHQTAARDPEHFMGCFTDRIQALAANQDLLIRNEWHGADVGDLVPAQLAHFADLIGSRIAVDGPKLHLNGAAAQAIGLALHELATNAGKYGALSADAGHVDVDWRFDDDIFAMSWIERNGPPVSRPERCGFGRMVIASIGKQTVHGEVPPEFGPSGVLWRLTCSAANALEPWERESIAGERGKST